MTPFQFIILALAVYRLTVLFVRDTGPFDIFAKMRSWRFGGKLLSCPRCVSLWIGIFATLYFCLFIERFNAFLAACIAVALSGIAIILDRTFGQ